MEPHTDKSPDELMNHFRGRSLKSIIFFTIVVHVVVIGGTSVPFLLRTFAGQETAKLSEEERVQLAVKEATTSIQKIAETHGIRPQQISDSIAGKSPETGTTPETPETQPETATPAPEAPAPETQPEPEKPKSEIEKDLEKKADGPTVPPIPKDEPIDLFK